MEILRKIYTFFIDIAQTLLLVFAVFLITYVFLLRPFQVNGDSMYPNFRHKQYILTNIIKLRFSKPKLGDVIVFKAPLDLDKDYIKRVIATPGDTILIQDQKVYLNGKILDQSKFLGPLVKTFGGNFLAEGKTIRVPNDSYFVLGDNRLESSDSREWGFVPFKSIIGESFFSYWPVDKIGIIKNPYQR